MFVGSIEKDKQGFYTQVSTEFTDLYDGEIYHPDMKWDQVPEEIQMSSGLQEQLAEVEHKVLKIGKPISTTANWITPSGLLKVVTHRKILRGGGFLSKEIATHTAHTYDGWPLLLNSHLKVLQLPNGKNLTRKDLCVLNLFVQGLPRKMIAHGTQTTVKAVEKRLAKIKDILTPEGKVSHNLNVCLVQWRLIPFLLAEHDWFAPQEWLVEHVAHAN